MKEKQMDVDRYESVTFCEPTACSEEATYNRDSLPAVTKIQKYPKPALPASSLILNHNRSRRGTDDVSEMTRARTKEAREFARRMITDGLLPLERVSRLTGMSMAMVYELAAEVVWKSKRP